MKKKEESVEKEINKLTSNFELDLLRLIKTQSFISMSKDVMNNELNVLKDKSLEFQKKLKEFSIQTIEIEEEMNSTLKAENDLVNEYLKKIRELLHNSRDYTDYISKDLNTGLTENIERLDSLHRVYLNEMEEFRKELDNRLGTFQTDISASEDELIVEDVLEGSINDEILDSEEVINEFEIKEPKEKILVGDDKLDLSFFRSEQDINFDDIEELTEADVVVDEIISNAEVKDFSEDSKGSNRQILIVVLLAAVLGIGYFFFDEINTQASILKDKIFTRPNKESVADSEKEDLSQNYAGSKYLATLDSNLQKIKAKDNQYVISVEFEYLRSGPSIYYESLETLKTGEKIIDLGEYNGQWLKVKTIAKEKEGWLPTKSIKRFRTNNLKK